jgi:DNA polymerase-3 subunit epsilon
MFLRDLDVLIVDCQTTGASPAHGHLLETAWVRTRASSPLPAAEAVKAHLIMLPPPSAIPRRISRLTGIEEQDLVHAVGPEKMWSLLSREAAACAMAGGGRGAPAADGQAPLVAHYVRFELAFLRDLHERQAADRPFPFLPLCTHAVAARLLPGLPGRGLRAVAGYFGHAMKRHKRAAAHVTATAGIWKNIVEMLEKEGVATMDDLFAWLRAVPVRRRARREYALPREGRLSLPDEPGVYRMLGKSRHVLYVGKASSLRRRVNSYFQKQRGHDDKTLEMLSQVWKVEVSVTATALEAALLESDEIKRLQPPYNRALTAESMRLWFTSPDLGSFSAVPDRVHTVGPLVSRALFQSLGRLGAGGPPTPMFGQGGGEALPVRAASCIEDQCFVEGLELFRQRHGLAGGALSCADLVRIGAALHHRALAHRDVEGTDSEGDGSEAVTRAEPEWTAETVAGALEHAVGRAAHQVRRARWLCLLSESSLAWKLERCGRRRLLVFEGGRIAARQDLKPRGRVPVPAGFRRTLGERQWSLTMRVYDRLRVLTTELRRMAAEGAGIEIRLGPGSRVRGRALSGFLDWV